MTTAYIEAAKSLAGDLASGLADDIRGCEEQLRARLGSDVETAEKIGAHVLEAGGKRLRPLFVSLAARATQRDYINERVHAIGACMEMIHMATLIHDDVIDGAELRRGRKTASAVWGNTSSILTGDVLLAKAMDILAEDGDLRIIRTVSKAVVEMAEGEVLEVQCRGDFDLDQTQHIDILRRKTAAFIACCCRVGAQIAGADVETENALAQYGESIGIGFQIADDLLDFRGNRETTGKPQATDFREGCATLPLIFLRSQLTNAEQDYVRSKFGNGVADSDIATISTWMQDRGAYANAAREANNYAEKARIALSKLLESTATEVLSKLADLLVLREA